jgi:hypothetical protein
MNKLKTKPHLLENAVVCSSCSSIIKPEDKKHCFWEKDEEQDQSIPKTCFNCFMENQAIEKDFGF